MLCAICIFIYLFFFSHVDKTLVNSTQAALEMLAYCSVWRASFNIVIRFLQCKQQKSIKLPQSALMYSWINWHIPPPSRFGPQDTILTDINQLNFNWSKFPYSQHKAFKWSSISKTNLFSSQKGEAFSFQFMNPLNLSTSCFNTTRIMWNGCTLERCTLPAFH